MIFVFLLCMTSLQAQDAILCEYYNTSKSGSIKPDDEFIEIVILKDHFDLAGCKLRDNASSGNWQDPYVFNDIDLWKDLRKGTIVVVYFNSYVPKKDIDKSDGFIQVAAGDKTCLTFTGSTPNSALNVAQGGDIFQLLTASDSPIHTIGHTPSSGDVYVTYKTISSPNLCLNTAIANNTSVVCLPGGSISDYVSGYGGKVANPSSATPGYPNSASCSDFWRELREPSWGSSKITSLKVVAFNHIELRWDYASSDEDSNNGYLLLRCQGKTWDNLAFPKDGTTYKKGDKIASAEVVEIIPKLSTSAYIDKSELDCDRDYIYRLYAYCFAEDPSDPDHAHGTSYNNTSFAQSGSFTVGGLSSPDIMTEDGTLEICSGDTAKIILRHEENYTNCTFQWLLNSNPITNETAKSIKVAESGKYALFITNERGCSKLSNTINLTVNTTPAIHLQNNQDKTNYLNDTTIAFCHDDLPTINAIINGQSDKIEWFKNGSLFKTGNKALEISATGLYQIVVYNGECTGYSAEVQINILDINLRLDQDSMYFDADASPRQKLKITNLTDTDLLLQKEDFILPEGFTIETPANPPYLIKAKDYLDLELLFSIDIPKLISGILHINAPCDYSATVKLTGKRKDPAHAKPTFTRDSIYFGEIPYCASKQEAVVLHIGGGEDCLIKTYNEIMEGFEPSFEPQLPHQLSAGDLKITLHFTSPTVKDYLDTLRLNYVIDNKDSEEPLELILTGTKSEPTLELKEGSNLIEFEMIGCQAEMDTFIVVQNISPYDITIEKNFKEKHIQFLKLPHAIKAGEKVYLSVHIQAGTYKPVTFSYMPCNIKSEPITINIEAKTPDIEIDLENDTLAFGRINRCLTKNDTAITVHYFSNDVPSKVSSLYFGGGDFVVSGLSIGQAIETDGSFDIIFRASNDGYFLDSLVIILEPCETRKVFYITATRYTPDAPEISVTTLDFGSCEIDDIHFKAFVITNNAPETIIITDIIGITKPFVLLEGELPYKLPGGGSSTNYTISYNPTVVSDLDTCTISVLYDSPCNFVSNIFLIGSAFSSMQQSKILLAFDEEILSEMDKIKAIPLYISSLDTMPLANTGTTSIRTSVQYDPLVLAIGGIQRGDAIASAGSNIIWNESPLGNIDISIDLQKPELLTAGKLCYLEFLPLLSNKLQTELQIISPEIKSDISIFEISTSNGLVKVTGKCNLENKNISFENDEQAFIEMGNVVNNLLTITIVVTESRYTDVVLYNITGQKILGIMSGYQEAGIYVKEINTSHFANGAYFLCLSQSKSLKTYKLFLTD